MTTIKKNDSTYFVEKNWTDKEGKEQTATVRLEINYSNKSCSIKPAITDRFVFVNSDLNKWIAVANCIRNAAEFAKIELEEKEKKESWLTEQQKCSDDEFIKNFANYVIGGERKNVYNHEGPEMEVKLSNDKVLTNDIITYCLPVSFDASSSYVFEGEYNSYSIGEALNHFRSFINERIKIGKVDNNEVFYLVFTTYKKWAISPLPMKNDILIAKYEHIK